MRVAPFYMRLPMSDPTTEIRIRKLRFRAWHRGFREADLIFGPFADQHLDGFSAAQLDVFEALLEHPDQLMYYWIMDLEPAPNDVRGEVFSLLQQFRIAMSDDRSNA